jgi:hypothetical protein
MRPVSFAKYRRIEKMVATAEANLADIRRRALVICAENAGERGWYGERGMALSGYRQARAEVGRCRRTLANSAPVKGCTRWYVGTDPAAYDAAVCA